MAEGLSFKRHSSLLRVTLWLRRHSYAGRCIATPSDRRSPSPSPPEAKVAAMRSSWRSGFDGARERIDPSTSSLCLPSSAFSSSTSSPTTLPQKVCSGSRSDRLSPRAFFFSFMVRLFLADLEVFGGGGRAASLGDVPKGTMRDPKRHRICIYIFAFELCADWLAAEVSAAVRASAMISDRGLKAAEAVGGRRSRGLPKAALPRRNLRLRKPE